MDIRILLLDENDDILDRFTVYQDGSDSDGAKIIRKAVEEKLSIEGNFTTAMPDLED